MGIFDRFIRAAKPEQQPEQPTPQTEQAPVAPADEPEGPGFINLVSPVAEGPATINLAPVEGNKLGEEPATEVPAPARASVSTRPAAATVANSRPAPAAIAVGGKPSAPRGETGSTADRGMESVPKTFHEPFSHESAYAIASRIYTDSQLKKRFTAIPVREADNVTDTVRENVELVKRALKLRESIGAVENALKRIQQLQEETTEAVKLNQAALALGITMANATEAIVQQAQQETPFLSAQEVKTILEHVRELNESLVSSVNETVHYNVARKVELIAEVTGVELETTLEIYDPEPTATGELEVSEEPEIEILGYEDETATQDVPVEPGMTDAEWNGLEKQMETVWYVPGSIQTYYPMIQIYLQAIEQRVENDYDVNLLGKIIIKLNELQENDQMLNNLRERANRIAKTLGLDVGEDDKHKHRMAS